MDSIHAMIHIMDFQIIKLKFIINGFGNRFQMARRLGKTRLKLQLFAIWKFDSQASESCSEEEPKISNAILSIY